MRGLFDLPPDSPERRTREFRKKLLRIERLLEGRDGDLTDELRDKLLEKRVSARCIRDARSSVQPMAALRQYLDEERRLAPEPVSASAPPTTIPARLVEEPPPASLVESFEAEWNRSVQERGRPDPRLDVDLLEWFHPTFAQTAERLIAGALMAEGFLDPPGRVWVDIRKNDAGRAELAFPGAAKVQVFDLPLLDGRWLLRVAVGDLRARAKRLRRHRFQKRFNLPCIRAVAQVAEKELIGPRLGRKLIGLFVGDLSAFDYWLGSNTAGHCAVVLAACWSALSSEPEVQKRAWNFLAATARDGRAADEQVARAFWRIARHGSDPNLDGELVAACLEGLNREVAAGKPGSVDRWLSWLDVVAPAWALGLAEACAGADHPRDWLATLKRSLGAVAKGAPLALVHADADGAALAARVTGSGPRQLQTWRLDAGACRYLGTLEVPDGAARIAFWYDGDRARWTVLFGDEHSKWQGGRVWSKSRSAEWDGVGRPPRCGSLLWKPGQAEWTEYVQEDAGGRALRQRCADAVFRGLAGRRSECAKGDLVEVVAEFAPEMAGPLRRVLLLVSGDGAYRGFDGAFRSGMDGAMPPLLDFYREFATTPHGGGGGVLLAPDDIAAWVELLTAMERRSG